MKTLILVIVSILSSFIFAGCSSNPPVFPEDRDGFDHAIREKRFSFQQCYEAFINKTGSTKGGKVVTQFDIDRIGKARNIRVVETTLNEPEVEQCMIKVYDGIRFPVPSIAPTWVKYPIIFKR